MANLLPLEAKETIRRVHAARFVASGAAALLAAAALTFLTFLPSFIILKMQEAQSSSAAAARSSEVAAAKGDLSHTQGIVTLLAPLATSTSFLDALDAVLHSRPSGAYLDSISYTKASGAGKGEIIVAGTSLGRESVNVYRIALEKDAHFQSVSVPVSALAGAQDGRFTITLDGAY